MLSFIKKKQQAKVLLRYQTYIILINVWMPFSLKNICLLIEKSFFLRFSLKSITSMTESVPYLFYVFIYRSFCKSKQFFCQGYNYPSTPKIWLLILRSSCYTSPWKFLQWFFFIHETGFVKKQGLVLKEINLV